MSEEKQEHLSPEMSRDEWLRQTAEDTLKRILTEVGNTGRMRHKRTIAGIAGLCLKEHDWSVLVDPTTVENKSRRIRTAYDLMGFNIPLGKDLLPLRKVDDFVRHTHRKFSASVYRQGIWEFSLRLLELDPPMSLLMTTRTPDSRSITVISIYPDVCPKHGLTAAELFTQRNVMQVGQKVQRFFKKEMPLMAYEQVLSRFQPAMAKMGLIAVPVTRAGQN